MAAEIHIQSIGDAVIESHFFDKAAVAAPHAAAADTGRTILAEGGNAIEAMIGMAATIAVVYPHMNAIGGDGFWLIHEPGGKVRYIEACGPAGARATPERYRRLGHDTIPPRGPLAAVTIPGTIGGWALAHEMSIRVGGRLPLADLLRDAVRLAREGYAQSPVRGAHRPLRVGGLEERARLCRCLPRRWCDPGCRHDAPCRKARGDVGASGTRWSR